MAYAMKGVHEYFAVLTTFVFKVGGAGTGDICSYDKQGCEMIRKAYNLPKTFYTTDAMDPRVIVEDDAGHGNEGHIHHNDENKDADERR